MNTLKIVELKQLLRDNKIRPLTGNKADLIQRVLDNNIHVDPALYKSKYQIRPRKSKKMIPYDYDNMTVIMLKKLLKSYMLKMTGRKHELLERIKAHVSKQDDEDFKPVPKSTMLEPTLEELEAIELPPYTPTKLLLPKEKKVPDKVADDAIINIETTINTLSDIGKNVPESLRKFNANNVVSNIAYLYVYDKYNKKSIIISKYNLTRGTRVVYFDKHIGINIYIPDYRSIEFKNGIFMNQYGDINDLDEFVENLSNYIHKYNEDAICIPFNFHKLNTKIHHANLLIYRPREHILEWFEPHGIFKKLDNKLYNYLQKGLIRLINLPKFKALIGTSQLVETHILVNESKYGTKALQYGSESGPTCMVWCVLIMEFIFLNPTLSTPEIIRDIFDLTQGIEQRIRINNMMKGYIIEIENNLTQYLAEFDIKKSVGNVKYTRNVNKHLQKIFMGVLIPRKSPIQLLK